jgi:hypothetical protein
MGCDDFAHAADDGCATGLSRWQKAALEDWEIVRWLGSPAAIVTAGGDGPAGTEFEQVLDWLAAFTRRHFGQQLRLLEACCPEPAYVRERATTLVEFRRRLASLYLRSTVGEPTAAARLRLLCRDLLQDAECHDRRWQQLAAVGSAGVGVRRRPRRDWPEVPVPQPAGQ